MVSSNEIFISFVGFLISLYGGYNQNLTNVVLGLSVVLITVILKFKGIEEDINILKSHINLIGELNNLKYEIRQIKDERKNE
jgi:hypothetical protein